MNSNLEKIMKLYRSYIDQKQFQKAISWLLACRIPNPKKYWKDLASRVSDHPDLFWFCCIHSGEFPLDTPLPTKKYHEVYAALPTVPSLLQQYLELSTSKREEWRVLLPSKQWDEISWRIPILLFEDKVDLLLSWLQEIERESFEVVAITQILTHLSKNEEFDFLCGLYLWKKTWHRLNPHFLSELGTWALEHWNCKEYPLSAKTIFSTQMTNAQKIHLADSLQVHIYDIEEHAFTKEIEPNIVEKNRNNQQRTASQNLYGILPVLDDLGSQATDSLVDYLCNHIQTYPNDIWGKATLLYIASHANTVSSDKYENVIAIRKSLISTFPEDTFIQCFDEERHEVQKFKNITTSPESIGALSFLDSNNKKQQQLFEFYCNLSSNRSAYNRFCIQKKQRIQPTNETKPSLLQVIAITLFVFAICIWLLGSALSKLL